LETFFHGPKKRKAVSTQKKRKKRKRGSPPEARKIAQLFVKERKKDAGKTLRGSRRKPKPLQSIGKGGGFSGQYVKGEKKRKQKQ